MEILSEPRLILLAGTSQNSGKTTLACHIIQKFCKLHTIIAIKITPHFYNDIQGNILFREENLCIVEELNPTNKKDSSKMLAAGAKKSFFIMASEEQLGKAFQKIQEISNHDEFIICESGGLRKWVKPAVFLMLTRHDNQRLKPESNLLKALCDRWITFSGEELDFSINMLEIKNNQWKLKNQV